MTFRLFLLFTVLSLSVSLSAATKPNIIHILCDDLGYGDVKCLNTEGKIATPHMDRVAREGMIFSDAHSSSAVCSPTRYGVITGRYNWRSRLQQGVLGGLSPRLIEQGRTTVASMLKSEGYATACIGKWHLGMDWVKKAGKDVSELNIETADQVNNVDFDKPITNGPNSVGFDHYFGISASLDMVPYCFIQNDHVTESPSASMKLVMNKGGPVSYTREGPAAPSFTGESVLPELTKNALNYIREHTAAAKEGKPFFLYMPLNAPHTPILPTKDWQGKSGINLYADFVMETDDAIGQIVKAIDNAGLGNDTLIVVTSDNGCSPSADYPTLLAKGHNPSYVFRGTKADIFDGGHHVPYLVRWPSTVKPGTRCDQYICLLDFMATCADIIGVKLPANSAEDSVSYFPALKGKVEKPLREAIVHHSINGSFSIRQDQWKLELCPDSGGWSDPRPAGGGKGKKGKANTGGVAALPAIQLYDLSLDIAETKNVQAEHPEVVERLSKLLEKYVAEGRSTVGDKQANTVEPNIWRYSKP